jgi:hypothetical protein
MTDLRVIDGGVQSDADRKRLAAETEVGWAIRDLVANILRIVAGSGKPLMMADQLNALIEATLKFQLAAGYWPTEFVAKVLGLEDERLEWMNKLERGEIDQASIERWSNDSTFERMDAEREIIKGALRTAASKLVGQKTQEVKGRRTMLDGINLLETIVEERRLEAKSSLNRSLSRKRMTPKTTKTNNKND